MHPAVVNVSCSADGASAALAAGEVPNLVPIDEVLTPGGTGRALRIRPVPVLLELVWQMFVEQRLFDAVRQIAANGFGPVQLCLPVGIVVISIEQDDVVSSAVRIDDRAGVGFAVFEFGYGEAGWFVHS